MEDRVTTYYYDNFYTSDSLNHLSACKNNSYNATPEMISMIKETPVARAARIARDNMLEVGVTFMIKLVCFIHYYCRNDEYHVIHHVRNLGSLNHMKVGVVCILFL